MNQEEGEAKPEIADYIFKCCQKPGNVNDSHLVNNSTRHAVVDLMQ